jgi:hypothetical protein
VNGTDLRRSQSEHLQHFLPDGLRVGNNVSSPLQRRTETLLELRYPLGGMCFRKAEDRKVVHGDGTSFDEVGEEIIRPVKEAVPNGPAVRGILQSPPG